MAEVGHRGELEGPEVADQLEDHDDHDQADERGEQVSAQDRVPPHVEQPTHQTLLAAATANRPPGLRVSTSIRMSSAASATSSEPR